MTVEISYFRSCGTVENIARDPVSSESFAITATPANSGRTPSGVLVLSYCSTEASRFEYGGSPSATATSHYVNAGEKLWLEARPGQLFSARTA